MIHRRKLLLGGGAALLLAGCATPGPGPGPGPTDVLAQVLGYLQTTCKIVADATAILALIGTFPQGTAALTIASAICKIIGGTSHRMGTAYVTINGQTFPAVTLRGITVPYAFLGTAMAARLRAAPLGSVVINGVVVPYSPAPRW